MIALPELHNLIRSLNKPEKRFFKLLSSTENFKVDKAIALFDYIEKINENDDVYFKTEKDKRIDTGIENLRLLYKLILKSQRNFYSESITGFTLNDELANLKILFEKAQYKQCRKMIKTVKEKARTFEKFSYLLELLELEKQLLHTEVPGEDYARCYNDLKSQKLKLVACEKNTGDYYQIYAKLRFQVKNRNLKGKKNQDVFYRDFLADPFLSQPEKALSRRAKFLQMKCRVFCYTALGEYDKREEQLIELKSFMQKDILFLEELPRQYIDVLYQLAFSYIERRRYAAAQKIVSEMNGLINAKKLLGTDLFIKAQSYAFTLELTLLIFTGKFTEASQLAQTIFEFIHDNQRVFNQEDKSVLFFNLANFYIYDENYSLAAKILSNSKTGSDKNSHWDLKAYMPIQEMIIYHELKEYSRFILATQSARALLKEKIYTTETDAAFINFFDGITKNPETDVPRKKFRALYNQLKDFSEKEEEMRINLNYFNFLSYASHKAGDGELKENLIKHLSNNEKNYVS
ncbi:MAG: hypothetical protein ACXVNM_02690 [Bacteroidia bacterium]